MKILAIDTSCDDTCAAVVENRKIITNIVSSQINLYKDWGGVVPNIAKWAHKKRIDLVINKALNLHLTPSSKKRESINSIDVIAVTQGPGLAVALEVGIDKAKALAKQYKKKLIAVNHIEGHLLSTLFNHQIAFPALGLTVSGGHSQIILIHSIGDYRIIGETLDDAAGEALDKAARILGLGYPGGPIIERLAQKGNKNFLKLPKVLPDNKILNFSFSGLKTSFYYQIKNLSPQQISSHLSDYAASYQEAVFEQLIRKFRLAVEKYQPKALLAAGGVMSNLELRNKLRQLAKTLNLPINMPYNQKLNTDNAAMIGLTAYYKALKGEFVEDIDKLDRKPRLKLDY